LFVSFLWTQGQHSSVRLVRVWHAGHTLTMQALYHLSMLPAFLALVYFSGRILGLCCWAASDLDPPTSTSWIVGITGKLHHTWPPQFLFCFVF
jgi:hypothetical protein